MSSPDLQARLTSLIETVRRLAEAEQTNVQLARHLEEQPQTAAQKQLPAFIRQQQHASSQLAAVHASLGQILQEVRTLSHPRQTQLLENLEYCYRMSGELAQQQAINATTGETVAADSFLQTGQVFSSFERMAGNAYDELREMEKRLAQTAREL